jgi:hypothetical protein
MDEPFTPVPETVVAVEQIVPVMAGAAETAFTVPLTVTFTEVAPELLRTTFPDSDPVAEDCMRI